MATRKTRKQDHRTRVGRERSERTETRVLEAALRVFADLGPDAPKIDDFVLAAGISRGTFYNHFDSVDELLAATSEWTTRELIEVIEAALEDVEKPPVRSGTGAKARNAGPPLGIERPALRFGVGLRCFFAKAETNPVWCRFVARVWKVGGFELPARDIDEGLRSGVFRAPSAMAARDLGVGGLRDALLRIGTEATPSGYGAQMTELCLQALGTSPRLIAAVMNHPLPSSFPSDRAPARADS